MTFILMNTNKDITLDTKLVGEIKGEFFVPSYQRGYRWGKFEVERLLNDVYQNGEKNYYLQPVVVCKKGEAFELVDGQQRLTTLYLIYKYMQNVDSCFSDPSFSLKYKTREQTADFLKKINLSQQEDNIDFWFIANAYRVIKEWFEKDLQIRVRNIFNYFKEYVKIIWYEVNENENAISLFTRLNIGKIPLTSAELVKAMFLSRDNLEDIDRAKQEEISLQWDNIEKELHNDSLWYFLTNDIKNKYQTRIDLVLDLISDKPANTREKYFTFFHFDEMHKKKTLDEIWRKIQHTFLVLKDWFEKHEWYHKIGYLIASNSCTLSDIFKQSKNKTKDEFNEKLDEEIKKSISLESGNYLELSYEKASDYDRISKLLLLFNVESVRQIDEETQWFPFDKFKSNVSWSLEHIHAQHSSGMNTEKVWREWIHLHIDSVRAVGNNDDLIEKMVAAKDKATALTGNEFKGIQDKVIEILSDSSKTTDLHSIANLALLNTADNAALNNSTFDVKRNSIIKMDKEGQYIPFCTKMVFLKYYTPSEKNQLHFWGPDDRSAYIDAINRVLKDYLEKPIGLEKEGA